MIIVKLSGGLGNQLFQYALGRHLAILNRTELKLDASQLEKPHQWPYRTFGLGEFNIAATKATKSEIKQLIGQRNLFRRLGELWGNRSSAYIKEPHFHFYESVLSRKDNLYLDGYWQSEKYFLPVADLLRNDLTLKLPLSDRGQLIDKSIAQCTSVSVHVRRGDYLTRSKANRYLRPCGLEYYHKAVDYLSQKLENPVFFVFSDDPVWAKEHLVFPFPTHHVQANAAHEDLVLMASCRHHIIANSTFSWWGAWLNPDPDKIVIAPQKWFSAERLDTCDLLPVSWIRL
ncbi:MAG: alpha-1,2-fucosyltransferase [Spirosomataceae bacterium]